jgi:hypothetical protein
LKATKAGWVEDNINERENLDLCDCCGNIIVKNPLPICGRSKKLSQLGVCIPLYLHFIKMCSFMLILYFIFQGIYNISHNWKEEIPCYNYTNESINHSG